jgi:hypothetical protein
MKKALICGVASFALAAMPAISTFAVGVGTQSHNVVVGEIDEPIYSIDLNWGSMAFDWRYDNETESFDFVQQRGPGQAVSTMPDGYDWINAEKNKGYIFEDEACRTMYNGEIVNNELYYWCPIYLASGVVQITDNSTNGKVKASASFSPETNYNWVSGKFGLWEKSGNNLVFNESENGAFQQLEDTNWDGTIITHTMINLKLEKNQNASGAQTVSANDKIGTITINIEPDLN